MGEGGNDALTELMQPPWFAVGRDSARAYATHREWLFRRVETIEFVGARSVKRSISVDFEVPHGLPNLGNSAAKGTLLVPVSVLNKWPRLMGFNFIGPTGDPTSLYLRKTNKRLDFGLLLGMVDLTLAHGENMLESAWLKMRRKLDRRLGRPVAERLTPVLLGKLAAIVNSSRPSQAAVEQAVNDLEAELRSRLLGALALERSRGQDEIEARIAATVDLAARLAASSILWVNVDGAPGTDRIVKFSYFDAYHMVARPDGAADDDAMPTNARRLLRAIRRVLIAFSWVRRTVYIPLPHAGRQVRFHLDIRSPNDGIELMQADVMAFPPAQERGGTRPSVKPVDSYARRRSPLKLPDESIGPESSRFFMAYGDPCVIASTSPKLDRRAKDRERADPEATAEIVDGRAHAYLGEDSAPSHRVFLQVKLAAARHGFVWGCSIAALIIAGLMSFGYSELRSAALHLDSIVVLLSVVPIVLGYVLVRPGEHALERYHLKGVRLLALISGATPIVGALTLVLTHRNTSKHEPDLAVARPIWHVLVYVSVASALLLLVSTARAARPRRQRESTIPVTRP